MVAAASGAAGNPAERFWGSGVQVRGTAEHRIERIWTCAREGAEKLAQGFPPAGNGAREMGCLSHKDPDALFGRIGTSSL